MSDPARALQNSPARILLAADPHGAMIVVVNQDERFRSRIAKAPPAGSEGYPYVRAAEYDRLKSERDTLLRIARVILADIDSDPIAVRFFDLRLIGELRAAIAESGETGQ